MLYASKKHYAYVYGFAKNAAWTCNIDCVLMHARNQAFIARIICFYICIILFCSVFKINY